MLNVDNPDGIASISDSIAVDECVFVEHTRTHTHARSGHEAV